MSSESPKRSTRPDEQADTVSFPKLPASQNPGDIAIEKMDLDLARFVRRVREALADTHLGESTCRTHTITFTRGELAAASMIFQLLDVKEQPAVRLHPAETGN